MSIIRRKRLVISYSWLSSDYKSFMVYNASRRFMLLSSHCSYLVDPASSHTLVLKIKPCMSKCFVILTLDCGRLIITVIVLLRLLYRWIPVVIAFFGGDFLLAIHLLIGGLHELFTPFIGGYLCLFPSNSNFRWITTFQ